MFTNTNLSSPSSLYRTNLNHDNNISSTETALIGKIAAKQTMQVIQPHPYKIIDEGKNFEEFDCMLASEDAFKDWLDPEEDIWDTL